MALNNTLFGQASSSIFRFSTPGLWCVGAKEERTPVAGRLSPALLVCALLSSWIASPGLGQPVRLAMDAFGAEAVVEIRDLPEAEARAAARAALESIFHLQVVLDPASTMPGSLGDLNRHAGSGEHRVLPEVAEVLVRGLQFCVWSNGAYGPLGGQLQQYWQAQSSGFDSAATPELDQALASADCRRLQPKADADENPVQTWNLEAGSSLDAYGLARGLAVDRAVQLLLQRGARNLQVEVGSVRRSVGRGPDGDGWPLLLNLPGEDEEPEILLLVDQAMTVVQRPAPGSSGLVLLDHRNGRPPRGTLALVVITERAADAEGLAASLYAIGQRNGQRRLGTLSPRPSVFWLLGQGEGRPLEATYRWSDVHRRESKPEGL